MGPAKKVTPLYADDLDAKRCQDPSCDHMNDSELFLWANCHSTNKLQVSYSEGIVTIRCGVCEQVVVDIAVQQRQ